jgi:hypothetical protein
MMVYSLSKMQVSNFLPQDVVNFLYPLTEEQIHVRVHCNELADLAFGPTTREFEEILEGLGNVLSS